MTPEDGSLSTVTDTTANVIDVTTDVHAPSGDVGVDVPDTAAADEEPERERELVFELKDLEVQYSGHTAVREVNLDIAAHEITAFIGPSGCGKTTVLRCLNRMHDLTPGAKVIGQVNYHGDDLYGSKVDPAEVRRRIGMVFQKPNPFPKTIFDNVAYGPKLNGKKRGESSRTSSSTRSPRRAVGRGEGQAEAQRARPSPVVSSSGSASRVRSRCSPTSCSWTSRAPRSTRSRPRASRT